MRVVATVERSDATRHDRIAIPGGTFRMGSDKHYLEEAPVLRVTVDEFWMDRTPATNRQFKEFVKATGYVVCRVCAQSEGHQKVGSFSLDQVLETLKTAPKGGN
jgi:formylglycine-generating enzyme required for sulfatase activity